MRLVTPMLALAVLSGCHLYFGDGRGEEDGGTWIPDARPIIDGPDDGWPPIDAPPPDGGGMVPRPSAPMRAHTNVNGQWIDQGLADWSCMGTPTTDQPSTSAMQLSGRVLDYQNAQGVAGAGIVAYAPSTSMIVGTGMTSTAGANRGSFTMPVQMLPATSRRFTFAITGTGYPGTYLLEQYIPPGTTGMKDLRAVSVASLNSMAAVVGVPRNPANAIALGEIVDCQGRAVSNAVAIASRTRTQTDPIGGARTMYFSAATTSIPVRPDLQAFSNLDGKFMIIDVPPNTSGFAVQVLGFRTQAELDANTIRLVSQVWSPANGGTASLAPYEPRRQGQ